MKYCWKGRERKVQREKGRQSGGKNSKEFSTNFIQTGEKEYNVGEVEGGGGERGTKVTC